MILVFEFGIYIRHTKSTAITVDGKLQMASGSHSNLPNKQTNFNFEINRVYLPKPRYSKQFIVPQNISIFSISIFIIIPENILEK